MHSRSFHLKPECLGGKTKIIQILGHFSQKGKVASF